MRGAQPGDSVAIDLLSIEPFGEGANAVLRDFGVLKEEFEEPAIVACPIRDGQAWFGDRVAIPLAPNLGTLSTMPPEGIPPLPRRALRRRLRPARRGCRRARVHLPVMVDDALIFMADPHAAISGRHHQRDRSRVLGTSAGAHRVEQDEPGRAGRFSNMTARLQIVGYGPSVEAATEDASDAAVGLVARWTGLSRREAYMLLGIVGELRIGTSPRPTMAARLIVDKGVARVCGLGRRGGAGSLTAEVAPRRLLGTGEESRQSSERRF